VFGADVCVPAGQFQVQIQFQVQLHGWLYVQLVVQPSPRVQTHVQVHWPGVAGGTAVSVAGVAVVVASAGFVQIQFQSGEEMGVASGDSGAVPVVQLQIQFHGTLGSFGIRTSAGSPGTTTPTTTFSGSVVVVTVVAPSAFAPFNWFTIPSIPGLATRMETLTLLGACCVAFAVD
jgi:hypothetical protein